MIYPKQISRARYDNKVQATNIPHQLYVDAIFFFYH